MALVQRVPPAVVGIPLVNDLANIAGGIVGDYARTSANRLREYLRTGHSIWTPNRNSTLATRTPMVVRSRFSRRRRIVRRTAARRVLGRFARRNRGWRHRAMYRGARIRPRLTTNRAVLPNQAFVKMRYIDSMVEITGILHEHRIRLNSIFDPDLAGTGHQPYLHDQMATLYKEYLVVGCKWRVNIMRTDTALFRAFHIVMSDDQTAAKTGLRTEWERGRVSKVRITSDSLNDGKRNATFKGYSKPWKQMGIDAGKYMHDEDNRAVFGANPVNDAILHVISQTGDEATSIVIRYLIRLVYYVRLYSREDFAQS